MSAALFRRVPGKIGDKQRSRAHQRKLPQRYIDKLWKLVKRSGPEPSAILPEPLIIRQQFAACITGIAHCAEFDQVKNLFFSVFAYFSGPQLGKKGVPFHRDRPDSDKIKKTGDNTIRAMTDNTKSISLLKNLAYIM